METPVSCPPGGALISTDCRSPRVVIVRFAEKEGEVTITLNWPARALPEIWPLMLRLDSDHEPVITPPSDDETSLLRSNR